MSITRYINEYKYIILTTKQNTLAKAMSLVPNTHRPQVLNFTALNNHAATNENLQVANIEEYKPEDELPIDPSVLSAFYMGRPPFSSPHPATKTQKVWKYKSETLASKPFPKEVTYGDPCSGVCRAHDTVTTREFHSRITKEVLAWVKAQCPGLVLAKAVSVDLIFAVEIFASSDVDADAVRVQYITVAGGCGSTARFPAHLNFCRLCVADGQVPSVTIS